MAVGIQLKVSPEELKKKADTVRGEIKNITDDWTRLQDIIINSKNYWVGEASNLHQKEFAGYKDDMETLLKRLKEHPDDLMKMAGLYEAGENKAKDMANALAGDIIT